MTADAMRWIMLFVAASLMCCAARAGAKAKPMHLLFWQASDICDGRNVSLQAHPFAEWRQVTLVPADAERPSLWYAPAAAVPADDGVRIYYQRIDNGEQDHLDKRTFCLGVLNGDILTLPDLQLHPQSWAGPANVVLRRSPRVASWGGFNVFQMVTDAEGYRLLYWDQPAEGPAGGMLATSPDGVHWTKDDRRTAVFTEHNDAFTLLPSGGEDGFLLYQTLLEPWPDKPIADNIGDRRRVISLRRTPDLATWSPQEIVLRPDAQDAVTAEFYLHKVFRYHDRYVGLTLKYYADPEKPGKHSGIYRYELMFSSDGVTWERPYRSTDMGAWSYATPFTDRGDLCLVAGAADGWRGIVLYRGRLDGLASCGADGDGSLCTPQFAMPESTLTLNADCRGGTIGVEVLDHRGVVVDGFSADRCQLRDVDGTDLPLRWGDRSSAELAGRLVQLRFTVSHARVFALSSARLQPTP